MPISSQIKVVNIGCVFFIRSKKAEQYKNPIVYFLWFAHFFTNYDVLQFAVKIARLCVSQRRKMIYFEYIQQMLQKFFIEFPENF